MSTFPTHLRWALISAVTAFSFGAVAVALHRESRVCPITSAVPDPVAGAASVESAAAPSPSPFVVPHAPRGTSRGEAGRQSPADDSPDESIPEAFGPSMDDSREGCSPESAFPAPHSKTAAPQPVRGTPARRAPAAGPSEFGASLDTAVPRPATGAPAALLVAESVDTPKREREYYDAFLALHRSDPAVLDASARGILEEMSPDCKKVALLRALYHTGSSTALDQFAFAMDELPEQAPAGCESVPSFAFRFVCERASTDAKARQSLERHFWGGGRTLPPERRRLAATALFASAPADELYRLTPGLFSERDPSVLEGAASGLASNSGDPAWARRVLEGLPVPPPPLDSVESPDE